MTRIERTAYLVLLPLATATALGCASTTAPTLEPAAAAGLSCTQLSVQLADAEAARHAALEKEQNAWKAVIPFAVAARYATSQSAVKDADERLVRLHAESARQGCGAQG